jgi:peptidoglycan/xylan/chitin deacetylase (PgdA/CDA1 family)
MRYIITYKRYGKVFLLSAIITLLLYSITDNIIDIYAVTSSGHSVCVPIIMYHQVKNQGFGKDCISPYEFESDLAYLSKNNYHTITMSDLISYVYEETPLPDNPIILTFDDGYLSTYHYVYPLLKQYDMKIVVSIVGKSIDDFSRVKDNRINYAHMTWEELHEMQDSGHVEIQNHTYNLHSTCYGRYGCYQRANETLSQYEQLLTEDTLKLQDRVTELLNITPTTFTYPYGKYNNTTENIIKRLGFKATLSTTYGLNLIKSDPEQLFGLRRICRSHNYPMKKLLEEASQTLKYRKTD